MEALCALVSTETQHRLETWKLIVQVMLAAQQQNAKETLGNNYCIEGNVTCPSAWSVDYSHMSTQLVFGALCNTPKSLSSLLVVNETTCIYWDQPGRTTGT